MKKKDIQILDSNKNLKKELQEELLNVEEFKIEMINFLLFPYNNLKNKNQINEKIAEFGIKLGCNLLQFIPIVGSFISETLKDAASLALNKKNIAQINKIIDNCITDYNKNVVEYNKKHNENNDKIPTLKEKYQELQEKYKIKFNIDSKKEDKKFNTEFNKEFNNFKDMVINNKETLLIERQNIKIKNLENIQKESNEKIAELQKKHKEQDERLQKQEERLKKIEDNCLYSKYYNANNNFEKINIRENNNRVNNL